MKTWSERGSDHFHLEVALSGGVDSVVLLHALLQLKVQLNCTISAVHVNHQLQAPAKEWAHYCHVLCEQWGVPLRIQAVNIDDAQQLGIEGAARKARYEVFAQTQADVVVLAHHSDDQLETALLALLRGGGVRALASMPLWRYLTESVSLWRPLLFVSKKEIEDYAQCHGLTYVSDPSNDEVQYLRNWLRHDVLPMMLSQHPNIRSKMLAGVEQLQHELALIDEIQHQDWQLVQNNNIIFVNKWLMLSPNRRVQQLLYFASVHQLGAWQKARLNHFALQLERNPHSRHRIKLSQGEIFTDKGRLFAWGEAQVLAFQQPLQLLKQEDTRKDLFRLVIELAMQSGLVNTQKQSEQLDVVLDSIAELRHCVPIEVLQKTVEKLKQAKVPLAVIEYWPCWYERSSSQLWIAYLEDQLIGSQHMQWQNTVAFLKQYCMNAKAD